MTVPTEQNTSSTAKSGLAAETKMGMAVVVILVVAFGFLVFHKFDLKQRGLLQASIDNSAERPPEPATEKAKGNPFGEFYPQADDVSAELDRVSKSAVMDDSERLSGHTATVPGADGSASVNPKPANATETFFDMNEPSAEPNFSAPEVAATENTTDALPPQPAEDFFTLRENQQTAQLQQEPEPQPLTPAVAASSAAASQDSTSPFDDDPFAGADRPPTDRKSVPLFADTEEPETATAVLASQAETTGSVPAETSFPAFGEQPMESDSTVSATSSAEAVTLPPASPQLVTVTSGHAVAPFDPRPVPDDFATSESAADVITLPGFAPPDDGVPATAGGSEHLSFGGELPIPDESATAPQPVDSTMLAMLEPSPDVNAFEDADDQRGDTAATKQTATEAENFDFPAPFPAAGDTGQSSAGTTDVRPFRRLEEADTSDSSEPFRIPQSRAQAYDSEPPVPRMTRPVTNPRFAEPSEPQFSITHMAQTGQIQQTAAVSEECEICEVRPNENYWTISKRVYGTPRYFSSLALFNRHRVADPKKLRPGMKVLIPDPLLLEQKYPELFRDSQRKPKQPAGFLLAADGSPAYRVGSDETLSQISSRHLGRASRWMEIYRMNQHILKDPHKLKEGTVLALPDDATDVHLAP